MASRVLARRYTTAPGAPVIHLQTDGSGLGLFIVKSIVIRHGGQVWVDSVEGKGTTFTVVIPVVADLVPKDNKTEEPMIT